MKTWFITAISRGDRVAATARKLADVADLAERFGNAVLPVALDVTNSEQVRRRLRRLVLYSSCSRNTCP
jgi:NADP-dependent 3-hydroxy acid dehydrogenase YdfG